MRAPLTIAALAAITGLGCHFGTRVERFPPAQGPAGVTAVLERKRPAAPILGELLALTDSALYVLRDGRRVTLVPFRVIRQGTFERMGDAAVVYEGRTPDAEILHRLRLVSRFPAGLTPDLLARLLAAYGQTAADRAEP